MFCGVAASSMPTVSLFSQRKNFSMKLSIPGFSSIRSKLARSQVSSHKSKISSDDGSSWRKFSGSTTHFNDEGKRSLNVHDLESGEYEVRAFNELPQLPMALVKPTDGRIHLTHDVQVSSRSGDNLVR